MQIQITYLLKGSPQKYYKDCDPSSSKVELPSESSPCIGRVPPWPHIIHGLCEILMSPATSSCFAAKSVTNRPSWTFASFISWIRLDNVSNCIADCFEASLPAWESNWLSRRRRFRSPSEWDFGSLSRWGRFWQSWRCSTLEPTTN